MKNNLFRKGLVIGVIFLFFSIVVQPITSINIPQKEEIKYFYKINNNYRKEDCNCKEVTNQDLLRVNRLLDNLEFKIKIIKLKYGYISDVKFKCNEILDVLSTLTNDGPICEILNKTFNKLNQSYKYITDKWREAYNESNLFLLFIYGFMYQIFSYIAAPVWMLAMFLDCSWFPGIPGYPDN